SPNKELNQTSLGQKDLAVGEPGKGEPQTGEAVWRSKACVSVLLLGSPPPGSLDGAHQAAARPGGHTLRAVFLPATTKRIGMPYKQRLRIGSGRGAVPVV